MVMDQCGDKSGSFRRVSSLLLILGLVGLVSSFGLSSVWGFFGSAAELCESSSRSYGLPDDSGWLWIPFPVASCRTVSFDVEINYLAMGWANSIAAAVSIALVTSALKLRLSNRS